MIGALRGLVVTTALPKMRAAIKGKWAGVAQAPPHCCFAPPGSPSIPDFLEFNQMSFSINGHYSI